MTTGTTILQTSFQRLVHDDPEHTFIDAFYTRLTGRNTEIAALFEHTDWHHQRDKLMLSLSMIVESSGPPNYLQKLGKDHLLRYGVRPAMADDFKAALTDVLSERLGDRYTDEVREAWESATDNILKMMFE
ncbi:MAG: globin domain-containing protein [Chloroflexota bacterium]